MFIWVDAAEDDTVRLLEPYAARVHVTVSPVRRGKTFGMRQLVAQSRSDLLAFTDANVQIPPHGLEVLTARLDEPDVTCASAKLRYTNTAASGTATTGAIYWSVEESVKSLESDRTGLIGVDGAFFVIERDAYPQVPEHLIEDLYVSLSVFLGNGRAVSVPEIVV